VGSLTTDIIARLWSREE